MRYRSHYLAVLVGALLMAAPGCDNHCDLEVTTSQLPDGVEDQGYAFNLESECGGDVWGLTDGSSLPPGITLNEDGELRGTPSVPGTFFFTVEVIDFHQFDLTEVAFAGLSLTVFRPGEAPTPAPTRTPTPTP